MNRIVVHYHEIALKRGNRSAFIGRLVQNMRRGLRGTGVRSVHSTVGRIVILLQEGADWPEIHRRLARTYGMANFAPAIRTEPDLDAIVQGALEVVAGRRFESFAVRTKRADKSFPVESPEVSRVVGAAIREHSPARVDLDAPELTLTIEIIHNDAFLSVEKVAGPGGLPVGTSERVLALLSGGIDSPVAAARMMRRGCRVDFVHFHAVPYQDRRAIEKATELAEILTRLEYESKLHLIPFGPVQHRIVVGTPRPYRVVLYRRMMFRIAEVLARRENMRALVSGESLGQVASQTLENMITISAAVAIPILRPLIGMDKQEISDQAVQLETFDVSIRPDQDCCQLFVPRHPATRASIERARDLESSLEIDAMVQEALASAETLSFEFPPRRDAPAHDPAAWAV